MNATEEDWNIISGATPQPKKQIGLGKKGTVPKLPLTTTFPAGQNATIEDWNIVGSGIPVGEMKTPPPTTAAQRLATEGLEAPLKRTFMKYVPPATEQVPLETLPWYLRAFTPAVAVGKAIMTPFELFAKGVDYVAPESAKVAWELVPKVLSAKILGIPIDKDLGMIFSSGAGLKEALLDPQKRAILEEKLALIPPLSQATDIQIEKGLQRLPGVEKNLWLNLVARIPGAIAQTGVGMVETLPAAATLALPLGAAKVTYKLTGAKERLAKVKYTPEWFAEQKAVKEKIAESAETVAVREAFAKELATKGLTDTQLKQIWESYPLLREGSRYAREDIANLRESIHAWEIIKWNEPKIPQEAIVQWLWEWRKGRAPSKFQTKEWMHDYKIREKRIAKETAAEARLQATKQYALRQHLLQIGIPTDEVVALLAKPYTQAEVNALVLKYSKRAPVPEGQVKVPEVEKPIAPPEVAIKAPEIPIEKPVVPEMPVEKPVLQPPTELPKERLPEKQQVDIGTLSKHFVDLETIYEYRGQKLGEVSQKLGGGNFRLLFQWSPLEGKWRQIGDKRGIANFSKKDRDFYLENPQVIGMKGLSPLPQKGLPKEKPPEIVAPGIPVEPIKREQVKIGDWRPSQLEAEIRNLSSDKAWWDGDPVVIKDLAEGFDLKLPKDIKYAEAREKLINHLFSKEARGWTPKDRYRRLVKAWEQGDIEAKIGLKLPQYDIWETTAMERPPTEILKQQAVAGELKQKIKDAAEAGDITKIDKLLAEAKEKGVAIEEPSVAKRAKEFLKPEEVTPKPATKITAITSLKSALKSVRGAVQVPGEGILGKLGEGIKTGVDIGRAAGRIFLRSFEYTNPETHKKLEGLRKQIAFDSAQAEKLVSDLYKGIPDERKVLINEALQKPELREQLTVPETYALLKTQDIYKKFGEWGNLPPEKFKEAYAHWQIENDPKKLAEALREQYPKLTQEEALKLANREIIKRWAKEGKKERRVGSVPAYVFFGGFAKRKGKIYTEKMADVNLQAYLKGVINKTYWDKALPELKAGLRKLPPADRFVAEKQINLALGSKHATDVGVDRVLNMLNSIAGKAIFRPKFISRKLMFLTRQTTAGLLGMAPGSTLAQLSEILFIPTEFGIIPFAKGVWKQGLGIKRWKEFKELGETQFDPLYLQTLKSSKILKDINEAALFNMKLADFWGRGITYGLELEKQIKKGVSFDRAEGFAIGAASKVPKPPFLEAPKISAAERLALTKAGQMHGRYTPESVLWWRQEPIMRAATQFFTPAFRIPERISQGIAEGIKSGEYLKSMRYTGLASLYLYTMWKALQMEPNIIERKTGASTRNILGFGWLPFRGGPGPAFQVLLKPLSDAQKVVSGEKPFGKTLKTEVKQAVKLGVPTGRAIGQAYRFGKAWKRGWQLSPEEEQKAFALYKSLPAEVKEVLTEKETDALLETSPAEEIKKVLNIDLQTAIKLKAYALRAKAIAKRQQERKEMSEEGKALWKRIADYLLEK